MPRNPQITDYSQTAQQAQADANRRPTAEDVFEAADEGLDLLEGLAGLLGLGTIIVGGRKISRWIITAKEKTEALEQIIQGNELFIANSAPDALANLKLAQHKAQTPTTERIVSEQISRITAKN